MAAYQLHHVKMGWLDPVVRRSCHAVDLAGTRESVMSEPESVKLVQAARLELRVPVAETMRQGGRSTIGSAPIMSAAQHARLSLRG